MTRTRTSAGLTMNSHKKKNATNINLYNLFFC